MISVDKNVAEKKEIEKAKVETAVSVCDIMKDNTTKLIRKVESQVPSYVETYSNLYVQYLHTLDDNFGACYIWQKMYFDRLGIDPSVIKALGDYWDALTEIGTAQLELLAGLQRTYVQTRIGVVKSYDQCFHGMMNYCVKMLSQFIPDQKS